MSFITEKQARDAGLPMSFKRTQLSYKDNLNRDHFIVSLNKEALKMFNLTVTFGHQNELKEIRRKFNEQLSD